MKKFDFTETYLTESFFDDIEDDITDNYDLQITNDVNKLISNNIIVNTTLNSIRLYINNNDINYNVQPNIDNVIYIDDNIQNCEKMFFNQSGLKSVSLKLYNNIRSLNWMFLDCNLLETINFLQFNTENVISMNSMFNGCESLQTLNLNKFNTSNVLNMNLMFINCKSLTTFDLSNFDTSKCETFHGMFCNCKSLSELNLCNFRLDSAINLTYMFEGCTNLKRLDISNFDIDMNVNVTDIFEGCQSLKYVKCPKSFRNIVMDRYRYCKNIKWDITN